MQKTFEILGKPIPLARARSGNGHFYDSQKQEKIIFGWAIKALRPKLYSSGIKLDIEFGMKIPTSSNKLFTMSFVGKPHVKKPDLDNLVKFVMDACLGILYEDDSIVSEIVARKVYVLIPRTIITVTEIDGREEDGQEKVLST
jgi:Holliday junction resolvase RusA-like endonuclease